MKIEYDAAKSKKNMLERNLPFSHAYDFDWSDALIFPDNRYQYPEPRFIVVGYLDNRLHVMCFTPITNGIRVISFRKANKREAKKYDKRINKQRR